MRPPKELEDRTAQYQEEKPSSSSGMPAMTPVTLLED
jgi:hypothetical protein